MLSYAYFTGEGVAQDAAEAVRWNRKFAEQGDVDRNSLWNGAGKSENRKMEVLAQILLGYAYYFGKGVALDHSEAVRCYSKAAEQDDDEAQFMLGCAYCEGKGVAQDYAEGVKWYRKAAEQGHATAQFNLGSMHDQGRGVPRDYVQALMWYNVAGGSGNAESIKSQDLVAKNMTAEQVAEAQRLAREWKPKTGK